MKLTIREQAGVCRWCGCTDERGCDVGCSWVNSAHTLCSACADLDALVRTAAGRRSLAAELQEFCDLRLGAAQPAPAKPARRRR